MVKVEFPTDANTKFEIQKWLKKYKIQYTTFQSKEDLLYLVSENKKIVCDLEKENHKALKLQQQQSTSSTSSTSSKSSLSTSSKSSSSSSTSSLSSTSSTTSSTGRSLSSPFKKIQIKDGQVIGSSYLSGNKSTNQQLQQLQQQQVVDQAQSANQSIGKLHTKNRTKLNLVDKLDSNNTLHVFISSTFKDMIGERDHLIKVVFPALNVKAKSKNITIVPVDLRWGLTTEETNVKGQIELCLKQLDKCGIMVSMIGSRFGWIPSEYKLSSEEDETSKWLNALPLGQSITSIEIQYGLSKFANKHSIAMLRDNKFIGNVPQQYSSSFNIENPDAETKLKDLSQMLIQDPYCNTLEGYPCVYGGVDKQQQPFVKGLDEFGHFVIDQLWQIIELEFPTPVQTRDQQLQEELYHKSYLNSKSQFYWGRETFNKKLQSHVLENSKTSIDKIGIVYGDPGSGKSSTLANLVKSLESSMVVLYHFVGCSGDSIDVGNILSRFSNKLVKTLNLKHEVPTNLELLRIEFPKILAKAAAKKKILIVIDDLDEISTVNQAHQMEWFPESTDLPDGVTVLLSCDENKTCWDNLHLRAQIPNPFYLTPLEMNDRTLIACETLARYGKKLDGRQLDKLISKTHAKYPLFIMLVCEELRIFGSFDKLSTFIQKLPDTIDQLIVSMTSRLEEDFGRDLIKKTLCFIALSRFGLAEQELLDLLKDKTTKQPLSFVQWAPLLINIAPLLRGDAVGNSGHNITFFHSQISKVIVNKYLMNEKASIVVHNQLADYYTSLGDPDATKRWTGHGNVKAFIELPYHLMKAKRFDLLTQLFQDLSFIQSKFLLKLGRDLIENMLWAITETQTPSLSGERWNGYNFTNANIVNDFYNFVQYHAHNLDKFPMITTQQASNMPDDSICHQVAQRNLRAVNNRSTYFKWVNKSQISDFVISSLSGHEDFVRCALYRPDGSLIASCSDDRTIRIWSGETGGIVRIFPKLHTDKITNLQWRGNNTLVTVSRDKRVVLWDEYGKVLHEFAGHKNAVWGVDVSGDGKRIVSASWDQTCIVWDVDSKSIAFKLEAHNNKLSACAYSNNSKLIATGCWGGVVIIWDARTGKELKRFKVTDSTILYMQFSHDDCLLSLSCVDTFTHIYSTVSWSRVAKLEGHKEAVISSRFAHDSKYIVSCSDDKTVRVYETTDWTQVSLMTGHSGRIISAGFHPSKRQVITAATDKFIKIWDPKLGYSVAQTHQGHRKAVIQLQYSPALDQLYSASDDSTIKIWEQFHDSDMLKLKSTINIKVKKFKLINDENNKDGNLIIAQMSTSQQVVVYNLATQSIVRQFTTPPASSFDVSHDDKLFAYSNGEGNVFVHDVDTFSEIYSHRHGFVVNEVCFSPSGDYLAASDGKGTFTILKSTPKYATAYTQVAYLTLEPMHAVTGMAWGGSADTGDKYLAVGANDGSTHIYDVKRSFTLVHVLKGHGFAVRGISFSPQCKYVYTQSLDKQSILWDVETGNMVTVFPLFSIATSNSMFYYDERNNSNHLVATDYTGKIHHINLITNSNDQI